ncbi:Bifunctional monothiol glutaredoxin-S16 [Durusdinium trenchii]|uniref:Chloroplastic (AtGrxS16) (Atypical GIY-YIG endonuclease) (CAX-interacting protein 2) (CAXIP1-like protein) n=1 Tax=Durusdinium trenchii TaxID=1381693 RepID=A0ABP0Q1E3_9DINO
MPLWAVILGWFFGCSGLLVLNAQQANRPPRLRIHHVDQQTGLTWTSGLGAGDSPAYDDAIIVMENLPKSRLGINLVHNQRKVSRVVVKEAFNAGWRVGDVILEVDGKQVRSNKAIQKAVQRALLRKKLPLTFKVRRWAVPDRSRGMLQLTKGGRREHLVPMLDIIRGVLKEFEVVLFMEGTLKEPKTRICREVVRQLDSMGLAFKAIDCTDQKANPEIRKIAKQISGEEVTTRDRMVIKCDTANGLDIGMVCS